MVVVVVAGVWTRGVDKGCGQGVWTRGVDKGCGQGQGLVTWGCSSSACAHLLNGHACHLGPGQVCRRQAPALQLLAGLPDERVRLLHLDVIHLNTKAIRDARVDQCVHQRPAGRGGEGARVSRAARCARLRGCQSS